MICRYNPKGTAAAQEPLSETSLKDKGEGKSSQWIELKSSAPGCSLCSEGERARCVVYIDIYSLWPMDLLQGQGLTGI